LYLVKNTTSKLKLEFDFKVLKCFLFSQTFKLFFSSHPFVFISQVTGD